MERARREHPPLKSILWPPNHVMVDIAINANAADNCDSVNLSAAISSNEPIDGTGNGDTSPDWTVLQIDQDNGIISFQLRAERSGTGDGRVYEILITASDESNNASIAEVEVIVPHNKGQKK